MMVFVILVETTSPTFSFLWPFFSSAIRYRFSPAACSASSRSRKIVKMRARVFFMLRTFLRPSIWPIDICSRSRKSCSSMSRNWCCSSGLSKSRIFCDLIAFPLFRAGPRHQLGPDGQLVRRQTHGLLGRGRVHAFHFKQHFAGANHRHPLLRCAFTFSHTGFSRLLGDGLIREEADPDLAAALNETRHGDAGGFNLAVGDPAAFERLETVLAKRDRRPAPGLSGHAPALLLAVFDFLRHQHGGLTLLLFLLAFRR